MKKLLILTNIAWLAITVFMAYTSPFEINVQNENQYNKKAPFDTCYSCTNDYFYGLTLNEFIDGVARYKRTHYDSLNLLKYMKSKAIQDARCCWYSLDTLKKFICLIEKYSSSFSINSDMLGIRFYYAVYPDSGVWEPSYKSQHTVFMVPTYRTTTLNTANTDFDPRYSEGVQSLVNLIAVPGNTQILALDGETANAKKYSDIAKNQGQLCPPTCNSLANTLKFVDRRCPNGIDWQERYTGTAPEYTKH